MPYPPPPAPNRRTVLKSLAALALGMEGGRASAAADVVLTPDMALSRPELSKLLQKLPKRGGRLVFSPGRFVFPEMDLAFGFDGFDDLAIRGQGAELLFTGTTKPFVFNQCGGLSLSGLIIDWPDPPFRQGLVKSLTDGGRTVEVALDPSQPAYSGAPVRAVLGVDPKTGFVSMETPFDFYGDCHARRTDEAGYRLELKFPTPTRLAPGAGLVLRQQLYGTNALEFRACSGGIELADVNVRAAPGMGLFARACKGDFKIRRFTVAPAPGSGRLMSTNADAMHFNGCVANVTVDDSDFALMGDDAINIYMTYVRVLRRVDARTLVVANPYDQQLTAGDFARPDEPLQVFSGADLDLEAEDRLAAVDPGKQATLHFRDDLPASVSAGALVRARSESPSLAVIGCRFAANRGRGVVGHQDVRIETCDFRDQSRSAVFLAADTHWLECCGVGRIVVRGNVIAGSCRSRLGPAAIQIDSVIQSDPTAPTPVGRPKRDFNHDVLIAENRIRNSGGPAIGVDATTRVRLARNEIRDAAWPAIRLADIGDCSITDNGCFPASTVRLAGGIPRQWVFENNTGLSVG